MQGGPNFLAPGPHHHFDMCQKSGKKNLNFNKFTLMNIRDRIYEHFLRQ